MKSTRIYLTFFLLCLTVLVFGQVDSSAIQAIGGMVSGAIQQIPEVQKNPFGFLVGVVITNLIGFLWGKFHHKKKVNAVKADYEKQIEDLKK